MRHTLSELLEDEGFEVTEVCDLRAARKVLFESPRAVGVLVLDLSLPDGDGEALLAELSESRDAPPTVLVSEHPALAEEVAGDYGLPHIAKPLDRELVVATLGVVFDNDIRPRARRTSTSSTRRLRSA